MGGWWRVRGLYDHSIHVVLVLIWGTKCCCWYMDGVWYLENSPRENGRKGWGYYIYVMMIGDLPQTRGGGIKVSWMPYKERHE